jgi:lipoprotein-anchoring transpeptidase ErfK/SrfK
VLTDGIEIDLERQLLLVVRGGLVTHVLNTSTGRSGWRTPPGDFAIDRQIDAWRHAPLGDLYRPKYFNDGIAVHGATSIPGQPASHGCTRVSIAAMDMLWSSGLAEVGTRVVVY